MNWLKLKVTCIPSGAILFFVSIVTFCPAIIHATYEFKVLLETNELVSYCERGREFRNDAYSFFQQNPVWMGNKSCADYEPSNHSSDPLSLQTFNDLWEKFGGIETMLGPLEEHILGTGQDFK